MERNFDSDFYAHVLNKIKSYIYVTDINTDEIIYMNDALKRLLKIEKPEGKICWKVLETGLEKRCDFCKIDDLIKSGGDGSYCWEGKSSITGRIYRM